MFSEVSDHKFIISLSAGPSKQLCKISLWDIVWRRIGWMDDQS